MVGFADTLPPVAIFEPERFLEAGFKAIGFEEDFGAAFDAAFAIGFFATAFFTAGFAVRAGFAVAFLATGVLAALGAALAGERFAGLAAGRFDFFAFAIVVWLTEVPLRSGLIADPKPIF